MKGIYRFHFGCGRMGDLHGIFVADSAVVKNTMGADLYFGEVLGKHSEIYGPLDEEDLTLVTQDEAAVAVFEQHDLASGFNPLDYVQERDDEEAEDN